MSIIISRGCHRLDWNMETCTRRHIVPLRDAQDFLVVARQFVLTYLTSPKHGVKKFTCIKLAASLDQISAKGDQLEIDAENDMNIRLDSNHMSRERNIIGSQRRRVLMPLSHQMRSCPRSQSSMELSELARPLPSLRKLKSRAEAALGGQCWPRRPPFPDLRAEPNEDHDYGLRMWGWTVVLSGASGHCLLAPRPSPARFWD